MADDLDRQFAALANRNRRAIVLQLGMNPASISRLATGTSACRCRR